LSALAVKIVLSDRVRIQGDVQDQLQEAIPSLMAEKEKGEGEREDCALAVHPLTIVTLG
jgi:hypothetical protein